MKFTDEERKIITRFREEVIRSYLKTIFIPDNEEVELIDVRTIPPVYHENA